MAEYCPKCNYKLSIKDWRPECPKCGVNVVYYGIEERLRKEADAAEYEHAKIQPHFDRLKFSLIGHPLSIVRLVLGLLPIAATLIPSGTINYVLPFKTVKESVGLLSIINFFSSADLDIGLLTKLWGSGVVGKGMLLWTVSIVSLVLALVLTLVAFILLTLSAAPRGIKRNIAFPIVSMVLVTVSFISFCLMVNTFTAELPGIFTGSVSPLAYIVVMLLYAAIIAVNVVYKNKNIEVKYTDVSELLLPYDERPSVIAKKAAGEAEAKEAVTAQA